MQSQYNEMISSDDEQVVAIARGVYDEYARQMREHTETPDITPAPALGDILDAAAQEEFFACDDKALIAAVRDQFEIVGSLDWPGLSEEV